MGEYMNIKNLLLTTCFLSFFITSTSYAGFLCDWFGIMCDKATEVPAKMKDKPPVESKPKAKVETSQDAAPAEEKSLIDEASEAIDSAVQDAEQSIDEAAKAVSEATSSAESTESTGASE
jgi:hypothetical protein